MVNPNSLLFLGDLQSKPAKQLKSKDFNNIFLNSTITANFLQNLEMLLLELI